MARFWLGPPSYPAGIIGAIDLRSLPQREATSTGLCLYATADATALGSDYINLGTDPTRTLTETQKRQWESALVLPATLVTNRLMAIVYETLTTQADPAGLDRPYPLMPTMRRRFEVWLAGQKVSDGAWSFTAPEFDVARDTLKRVYRQLRTDSLEGRAPLEHYRKWLGFQVRKFGLVDNQYRALEPEDLPDETPLEPTTVFNESFNQADSTTLGPDLTWTETLDNLETFTSSYRAVNNVRAFARAEHDLSSSDTYAQITIANWVGPDTNQLGPMVRMGSATGSAGYLAWFNRGATNNTRLASISSVGDFTFLGTAQTVAWAVGDVARVEADGSTIRFVRNGGTIATLTDTGITSGVRAGVYGRNTSARGDSFEMADLGAAGISGDGAGTLVASGSAAGTVLVEGDGDGALVALASAAGTVLVAGAAAAALVPSGLGAGTLLVQAAGAGAIGAAASATGSVLVQAAGSATLVLTGAGDGSSGAATGDHLDGRLRLAPALGGRVRVEPALGGLVDVQPMLGGRVRVN